MRGYTFVRRSPVQIATDISEQAKACRRCADRLPFAQFKPDARSPDGRWSECRACAAPARRGYDRRRLDRIRQGDRRRFVEEIIRDLAEGMKTCRECSERKPLQAFAYRSMSKRTGDQRRALCRDCLRARTFDGRLHRERLLSLAGGTATAAQIAARVAYWGHRCWICRAPWQAWTPEAAIDHVKPVAKGGSNWPANLRPICRSCNSRKRDRWPWPLTARVA